MKLRISAYFLAAAALASLPACSNDSDYTYVPGEPVAPGCPGVYFAASNSIETILSPDDASTFDLIVGRTVTDGELTVPVIASNVAEGLSIPSSVTFAAGEAETTLKIDATALASGSLATFTVSVPEEYINPYVQAPGIGTFSGRVVCAEWKLWADNVEFTFDEYYDPIYGQIYELEGVGKYYIPNFLNTGLDLYFTMENSKTSYCTIDPYRNCAVFYDSDYEYSYWYVYDDANRTYPVFNIQEGAPEIEYMQFFDMDTATNYYYTYICPDYNVGVFSGLFYYTDGSSDYNDVTFTW